VERAVEEWEELVQRRRPTPADVDALARRHRILCGKWMAFPRSATEADAAWGAVARAAAGGALACPEVKISSASPRDASHVICCYTDDYLNKTEVDATAAALRAVLPPLQFSRLLYKSDLYTYLGLYKGNEYGLRPTLYEARL
jgi:hypothetical protein